MRELKVHQSKNCDALIAAIGANGGSLDASDTGTGKSTTLLAMCKALDARPAIITRKAIIPGWRDECAAMGVDPLFIVNYEAAKSESFPYGRIVNGSRDSQNYEWNVSGRVIFGFDEVQACRDRATINTKMLRAASQRHKTHMMSATPFTQPMEAFGVGTAIGLFTENKYWSWLMSHGVRRNFMNRWEFIGDRDSEKAKAEGLRIMDKIHHDIFPSRGVRTTRAEIPGFPEQITTTVLIEVEDPGAIEKAYLDLIAVNRQGDWERAIKDVPEDIQDCVQPLAITQNLRARQEAEIHKCRATAQLARDAVSNGESVAIFQNFDASIEMLRTMLKTDCFVRGVQGKEDNLARHRSIREFQANRQDVILVNNQAGGAGLSLHDPVSQKPRTSLISPPQSAVQLRQILGRDHRLGCGYATHKLLFAAGTIEEKVRRKVQGKIDCLDTLLDSDLEVNG